MFGFEDSFTPPASSNFFCNSLPLVPELTAACIPRYLMMEVLYEHQKNKPDIELQLSASTRQEPDAVLV